MGNTVISSTGSGDTTEPDRGALGRRLFIRGAGAAGAAGALGLAAAGAAAADPRPASAAPATWMSGLPDGTRLDTLTIPGTHDTCATDPANGTEWSHCQNMGIPEQLQRGIRFFDIRCGAPPSDVPGELGVYHAQYYQDITFNTVLDQCRSFLTGGGARETIVMRVKNEHGMSDDDFRAKFEEYLGPKGYGDLFLIGSQVPSLGAARGKVVLLTQFANDLGALAWPAGDNGVFTNDWCELEDLYDASVADKKAAVQKELDAALADRSSGRVHICFTSLAPSVKNGLLWPKTLADQVMPAFLDHLDAHPTGRLGIVPMDFPDFHEPAMQKLIDRNFS